MSITLQTCGFSLCAFVLASVQVEGETSRTEEPLPNVRSLYSQHQVIVLPGYGEVANSDLQSIKLPHDSIVTLSKSNGVIRYQLGTPRGEQNIYVKGGGEVARLAFDPAVRELRILENTVRVTLTDYTKFDELLSTIGTHGRAFPVLDRAYLEVPKNSSHETLYEQLDSLPHVRSIDYVFVRENTTASNPQGNYKKKQLFVEEGSFDFGKTSSSRNSSETKPHYAFGGNITITEISPKDISGHISITNEGEEPYRHADGGRYEIRLGKLAPDFSDLDSYDMVYVEGETLFEIPPGAIVFKPFFRLRPNDWEANQVYVLVIGITTDDGSSSFGHKTFATNHDGEPIVTCPYPGRVQDLDLTGDPFYEYQWALKNTGQSAFGAQGGVENEDVRMSTVRDMNLGGRNVHVGIVDTGLDICHPDLQNNIAQSQSINFRHRDWDPVGAWRHVHSSDPYNPILTGDHGTAMAGAIGAVADNGIAIRGVAPYVWLRGFNYLSVPTTPNYLTSLGSGMTRHTNDVDVFNLSFGDNAAFFITSLVDVDEENAPFAHGTTELREGLGALYVKATGNEFIGCDGAHNVEIGCVSSQTDRINSSPYVISVGGLNAAGTKAEYSNAGSNVWVTAPGGSRDTSTNGYPGLMSIDQFGLDRGHMWTKSADHWSRDKNLNPRGSVLAPGGTSLSNAIVSGAIAILLEAKPELTWRDVKHVLAASARRVDADIEQITFSHASLQEDIVTQHAWRINEAGYAFHNYYGFGALDIDEMVALADEYEPDSLGKRVMSDWVISDNQSDLTIPDANSQGVVVELTLDSDDIPQDTTVEAVELVINLSHTFASDLQFEVTSPSDTVSIVSPAFNVELRRDLQSGLVYFGSNAFYGERTQGTWQIRFRDVFAEDVGSVHSAYLRIHGGSKSSVSDL